MLEMEVAIFAILAVQVVLVPYQLIAPPVQTTKPHSEYLIQTSAYVRISTLMIIKIRFASHVHLPVTPVRILKTTV